MRILSLAVAVVAAVCATGCSTPLASRRAQVLEKGEVEFVAVPTAVLATLPDAPAGTSPVIPLPHVEGSVRFGIFDRADLQLKVDEALFPELAFGYQILGDPHVNEFAMTFTAGAKVAFFVVPSFGFGSNVGAGNISMPLQLLFDVPLGEEAALYFGTRTILGSAFASSSGDAASGGLVVTPGLVVGASIPFGWLLLQPELAANYPIPVGDSQGLSDTGGGFIALGVGVGTRFNLDDMRAKK